MNADANTAVVILNYNGERFLQRFLPSVIQHSGNAQVVVADNCSTDNSLSVLQQEEFSSKIRLIQLEQNYGFCGGYNRALKQVEARYYVLLNSDVEVSEGWLEPILARFEQQPNLAACQPKILQEAQPSHFEYAGAAGGAIDWLGYPFCRGRLFDEVEEDQGQYDDHKAVFWASGASLFIRSSCYWEMGGLDERFFAHMEEIDLCWRLQRAGYQIGYCGESTVYHVGGGTLQADSPFKTFLNFRNGLLLLLKNLPPQKRWQVLFMRMVLDGVAALRFLISGKPKLFSAVLKAHFAFYKLLPQYWSELNSEKHSLPTVYPHSIVWGYFVRGKKHFRDLDWGLPYLPEG